MSSTPEYTVLEELCMDHIRSYLRSALAPITSQRDQLAKEVASLRAELKRYREADNRMFVTEYEATPWRDATIEEDH